MILKENQCLIILLCHSDSLVILDPSLKMGKKRVMSLAKDVDSSAVKYEPETIQGQLVNLYM